MSIQIKTITSSEIAAWDDYVYNHPQATLYHVSGWKNIIEKTYGHKTYYLMAVKDNSPNATDNGQRTTYTAHSAVGILPLVHLKHFLFGNSLISKQL